MTALLGGGLALVAVATVYLFDIVRRKGPSFEYAMAMFFGEFGLMIVGGQLLSTAEGRIAATIVFGAGMMASAVAWWILLRRHQRQHHADRQQSNT